MYRVPLLSSRLSSRGGTFPITEIVPPRQQLPVDNVRAGQTGLQLSPRNGPYFSQRRSMKLDNTAVPFKADSFVLSFPTLTVFSLKRPLYSSTFDIART
jgi:hypothetical protein